VCDEVTVLNGAIADGAYHKRSLLERFIRVEILNRHPRQNPGAVRQLKFRHRWNLGSYSRNNQKSKFAVSLKLEPHIVNDNLLYHSPFDLGNAMAQQLSAALSNSNNETDTPHHFDLKQGPHSPARSPCQPIALTREYGPDGRMRGVVGPIACSPHRANSATACGKSLPHGMAMLSYAQKQRSRWRG